MVLATAVASSMALNDGYLSRWMGELAPSIDGLSLLDISLPGTHDSLTYDLSARISDGANDLPTAVSWLLHEFTPFLLPRASEFTQGQAISQWLNVTAQLQNGVRFLDFRTMYSAGPDRGSLGPHDWYGLHMLESNSKALVYLEQIRDWMQDHPTEIVTIWISRHGEACKKGGEQYPNVTPEVKQAFWARIKDLFGGLLYDRSSSLGRLNETTIGKMVAAGQRFVVYAADHAEFTASDSRAYDACTALFNELPSRGRNVDAMPELLTNIRDVFVRAPSERALHKAADQLYLVSLAGDSPPKVMSRALIIDYLPNLVPIGQRAAARACASALHIPGYPTNSTADVWCPSTLLDVEQLRNYYFQAVLEDTAAGDPESLPLLQPPGAIYLDALDVHGTIRTGAQRGGTDGRTDGRTTSVNGALSGEASSSSGNASDVASGDMPASISRILERFDHTFVGRGADDAAGVAANESRASSGADGAEGNVAAAAIVGNGTARNYSTAGYSYVDTLLYFNARVGCASTGRNSADCAPLLRALAARRALRPMMKWDDPAHGRLASWP